MKINHFIEYFINSNTLGVVPIKFGISTPTLNEKTKQWETWSRIFVDGKHQCEGCHEGIHSLKTMINAMISLRLDLEDVLNRHDSALFITTEEAHEGRFTFPLDQFFGDRTLHDPDIPRHPKQYTRDLNDLE